MAPYGRGIGKGYMWNSGSFDIRWSKAIVLKLLVLASFFLGLFFTHDVAAEELPPDFTRFESLTIEDGLSQNTVGSILQDRRGYIWLGTEAGLHRYDGQQFRLFRHDPDDPGSLADNFALSLEEDGDGQIWVGTMGGGVHRLNPRDGTVERIPVRGGRGEDLGIIWDLHVDDVGQVWAASQGGALLRRRGEAHFRLLEAANEKDSPAPFTAVGSGPDGRIVFGTGQGLVQVDESHSKIEPWHELPSGDSIPNDFFISALMLDREGRLWAGGGGGLFHIDQDLQLHDFDDDHPVAQQAASHAVWDMAEGQGGHIWMASYGGGLWSYHPGSDDFRRYEPDPSRSHSLSENNILAVSVDQSGLVWVGTESHGAQKINPQAMAFGHFTHHPTNKASLPNPVVWAIEGDQDNIVWVGTQSGLAGLRWPEGDSVREVIRPSPDEDDQAGPEHHISSLHRDPDSGLWIGTLNGLWWMPGSFDPESEYRQVVLDDKVELGDISGPESVLSIASDDSGNVFFSFQDQVLVRIPSAASDGGDWHIILESGDHGVGLIHGLWYAGQGQLWVAGETGLVLYDLSEDSLVLRIAEPDQYDGEASYRFIGMNHGGVNDLIERDGILWLAGSLGAFRLDMESGDYQRYTEDKGLPSDVVYSIEGGDEEHVWLTTAQGLVMLSESNGEVRVFDVSDGLQSNEFNAGASTVLGDGRLAFGGLNGVNVFQPSEVLTAPSLPSVEITGVRVSGSSLPGMLFEYDSDPIMLDPSDDVLEIEFSALDFRNPARNRFRFRLVGFEEDWRVARMGEPAVYTNLPPGRYIFHIQAASGPGAWNEDGARLKVIKRHAPWEHPLAWLAYGLLAMVLLLTLVRRWGLYEKKRLKESHASGGAESIHALNVFLRAVQQSSDVDRADAVLDELHTLIDLEAAALFKEGRVRHECIACVGPEAAQIALARIPALTPGAIARARESGGLEPLRDDERVAIAYPGSVQAHGLVLPVVRDGQFIAALVVTRAQPFSPPDHELLENIRYQLAWMLNHE